MRIPLPDRPDERVSIPVLERQIHVVIDPRYGSQQFLKRNWQWLIATLAGLGGAVAAWLKLFRGGD
jgi:DNA polymerase II small subunit/DNA polymerase delta subunit B